MELVPPNERDADVEVLIDRLIDAGVWDAEHLSACYDVLNAEGRMILPAGEARNLTTAERLKVARLAQSGKIEDAL